MGIKEQCVLLGVPRSTYYYTPAVETEENLRLMRQIDEYHYKEPAYGSRMIAAVFQINRKKAKRLMPLMGLETVYPKPRTICPGGDRVIYPYFLKGKTITRPDQVWSTDITYIPMKKGFVYLTAVIDWYSRYILSWRLSNTMDKELCMGVVEEALLNGTPEIFNTDQGSQYTNRDFIGILKAKGIQISMDGRRRALDNAPIERFWRTIKYERIYLQEYDTIPDLEIDLSEWFKFYCESRPHSALGYRFPKDVYFSAKKKEGENRTNF